MAGRSAEKASDRYAVSSNLKDLSLYGYKSASSNKRTPVNKLLRKMAVQENFTSQVRVIIGRGPFPHPSWATLYYEAALDQRVDASKFCSGDRETSILLQPQTRPISQKQLINEVKEIYAGLIMVEKKCVEIDQQQASATNKLSNEQWQALITVHSTLLH